MSVLLCGKCYCSNRTLYGHCTTAAIYQIEEDNRAAERELVKPALMTAVQLPDSFCRYNSRTFAVLQTNFSSSFFPGEKSRRSCTRKLFLLLMTGGGGGGSEKELVAVK